MEGGGLMHELRDFVDSKEDIRTSEGQIMVGSWISEGVTREE